MARVRTARHLPFNPCTSIRVQQASIDKNEQALEAAVLADAIGATITGFSGHTAMPQPTTFSGAGVPFSPSYLLGRVPVNRTWPSDDLERGAPDRFPVGAVPAARRRPRVHRDAGGVGAVARGDSVTAGLYGEITLKDGQVEQAHFDTYQTLRMNEAPQIEVHIVKSAEPPGGMGETGTLAIVPAIANAIFAATSKRLRKMPIDAEVLKQPV